MSKILYEYKNKFYLNLTNECPCACVFCIRDREGIGSEESLWLEETPGFDQVKQELSLKKTELERKKELVICGYGEPFCALELLEQTCAYVKKEFKNISIRVNTNGLGDLITKKNSLGNLSGLVDEFSVSLNAGNARKYQELTQSEFGEESFFAMLEFAKKAKEQNFGVILSVINILSQEELLECEKLCEKLNIKLRVRELE